MTSKKKIDANGRNAKRSTGPTSTIRTKLNAISHGILSVEVLIRIGDGMEDSLQFEQLSNSFKDDLSPVGALEELLLDQLILVTWRWKRVLKYETALISKQSATVKGDWDQQLPLSQSLQQRLPKGLPPSRSRPLTSPMEFVSLLSVARSMTVLELLEDEPRMTNPAVQMAVLDSAREFGVAVDDILGQEPNWVEGEIYPKELIEQVIDKACELGGFTHHEFWKRVGKKALNQWRSIGAQLTEMSIKEDREVNLFGIPDEPSLAKIQRYEAHLSRQFYKALHELQRVQATRRGQGPPAPLALDIDINNGPSEGT